MMNEKERAFWQLMKRLNGAGGVKNGSTCAPSRGAVHAVNLTRLEIRNVSGWPDVMFVGPGVGCGFIELKVAQVNRAGEARLGLRPGQALWLGAFARNGGRAFIFARLGVNLMLVAPGRMAATCMKPIGLPWAGSAGLLFPTDALGRLEGLINGTEPPLAPGALKLKENNSSDLQERRQKARRGRTPEGSSEPEQGGAC